MERNHLKVYYGPEDEACATLGHQQNSVSVPLAEIFPLLADAVQNRRTWLGDFSHDEITISTDLYEVLLAYQHCRRPSA